MSIKISELPQASTVNNTDVIPIVQGGTTKKAPAGLIHPTIATDINSTSTNDEVAGAKAVYDSLPTMTAITVTALSNFTVLANHSCAIETGAGKLVTINIAINGVSCSSNTWTNIAQIQEGCRPVGGEAYGYITVANNAYVITSTYIAVSGIIGIKTSSSLSNANVRVQTAYFVPTDSATRSLNLSNSANTGELVGTGDRVELTDETKKDDEQVKEQVENISEEKQEENQNKAEPIEATKIETNTEGSGDSK